MTIIRPAHQIVRHPDRIELRDASGLLVATLGPSCALDARELAAAPSLLDALRDARDTIDEIDGGSGGAAPYIARLSAFLAWFPEHRNEPRRGLPPASATPVGLLRDALTDLLEQARQMRGSFGDDEEIDGAIEAAAYILEETDGLA